MEEPAAYGKLGLANLLELREECLREFYFFDAYRSIKQRYWLVQMSCFKAPFVCRKNTWFWKLFFPENSFSENIFSEFLSGKYFLENCWLFWYYEKKLRKLMWKFFWKMFPPPGKGSRFPEIHVFSQRNFPLNLFYFLEDRPNKHKKIWKIFYRKSNKTVKIFFWKIISRVQKTPENQEHIFLENNSSK